ncbi:MAG: hypothetical protein ABUM26_01920, partial [Solirubrobacterales bacterium]
MAVIVVVVIGLSQSKSETSTPGRAGAESFDLAAAKRALAGAPAPLTALHDRANELIPADKQVYER